MKPLLATIAAFFVGGIMLTQVAAADPCGLPNAAFCDTFDSPAGNPASRSGDLNPIIWGVSRATGDNNIPDANQFNRPSIGAPCVASSSVPIPRDVQVCGGRLVIALDDGGSTALTAAYPKQPFDWAGRTGTVVFDVGNDAQGTHSAWPEFWITDQPVPAPQVGFDGHPPSETNGAPRNAIGISFANCPTDPSTVGVDQVMISRNYSAEFYAPDNSACVNKGGPNALNHYELRLTDGGRLQVFATQPGQNTLIQVLDFNAPGGFPMTRGVIWVENVHYNGDKGAAGYSDHQFVWDNVGFDGPTPYRDLTYDVQDNNASDTGEERTLSYFGDGTTDVLSTMPASWQQTPSNVLVTFSWYAFNDGIPCVSVNGNAQHCATGGLSAGWFMHSNAIVLPFSEVVSGVNSLQFTKNGAFTVSNINLALIAASPVPGGTPSPSPTSSVTPTTTSTPSPSPTPPTPSPTASPSPSPTATSTSSPSPTTTPAPNSRCRLTTGDRNDANTTWVTVEGVWTEVLPNQWACLVPSTGRVP